MTITKDVKVGQVVAVLLSSRALKKNCEDQLFLKYLFSNNDCKRVVTVIFKDPIVTDKQYVYISVNPEVYALPQVCTIVLISSSRYLIMHLNASRTIFYLLFRGTIRCRLFFWIWKAPIFNHAPLPRNITTQSSLIREYQSVYTINAPCSIVLSNVNSVFEQFIAVAATTSRSMRLCWRGARECTVHFIRWREYSSRQNTFRKLAELFNCFFTYKYFRTTR